MRAMPYIWTWVSQNDDTGINLLKRAIELNSGYARAHCLLAYLFASRVLLGTMDYERGISESLIWPDARSISTRKTRGVIWPQGMFSRSRDVPDRRSKS